MATETADRPSFPTNPVDAAVDELLAAGFAATTHEGIPFVPIDDLPTMERKRDLIRWIETADSVGGARLYAEGVIFMPPLPPKEPKAIDLGFPYDEPEVVVRYGIEMPGGGER